MIIIGCDYHPGFQQIALWIPKREIAESNAWNTVRAHKSFIASSLPRGKRYV